MTQKKILLAVAIASTGMIFATGCARPKNTSSASHPVDAQAQARSATFALGEQIMTERFGFQAAGYDVSYEKRLTKSKKQTEKSVAKLDGQIADQQAVVTTSQAGGTDDSVAKLSAAQTEIARLEGLKSKELEKQSARDAQIKKWHDDKIAAVNKNLADAREAFTTAYNTIFNGLPKMTKEEKNEKGEVTKASEIVKDENGNVVYEIQPANPSVISHVTLGYEAAQLAVEGRQEFNAMTDLQKAIAVETPYEIEMLEGAVQGVSSLWNALRTVRTQELNSLGIKTEALVSKKAESYVNEQFPTVAAQVMSSQLSFGLVSSKIHNCEACAVENATNDSHVGSSVTDAITRIFADRADAEKKAHVQATEEGITKLLTECKDSSPESVKAALDSINRGFFSLDTIRNSIESVSNRAELSPEATVSTALLANTK